MFARAFLVMLPVCLACSTHSAGVEVAPVPWSRESFGVLTAGKASERGPAPLQRYLDFIRRKKEELAGPGVSARERWVGHAALSELMALALSRDERQLARKRP